MSDLEMSHSENLSVLLNDEREERKENKEGKSNEKMLPNQRKYVGNKRPATSDQTDRHTCLKPSTGSVISFRPGDDDSTDDEPVLETNSVPPSGKITQNLGRVETKLESNAKSKDYEGSQSNLDKHSKSKNYLLPENDIHRKQRIKSPSKPEKTSKKISETKTEIPSQPKSDRISLSKTTKRDTGKLPSSKSVMLPDQKPKSTNPSNTKKTTEFDAKSKTDSHSKPEKQLRFKIDKQSDKRSDKRSDKSNCVESKESKTNKLGTAPDSKRSHDNSNTQSGSKSVKPQLKSEKQHINDHSNRTHQKHDDLGNDDAKKKNGNDTCTAGKHSKGAFQTEPNLNGKGTRSMFPRLLSFEKKSEELERPEKSKTVSSQKVTAGRCFSRLPFRFVVLVYCSFPVND